MKIYVNIEFLNDNDKLIDFLDFFPQEVKTPWDEVEIHPIIEIENVICEVIQEGKESFGVYIYIRLMEV